MSDFSHRSYLRGGSLINVGRFTYGDERIDVREWGEGASLTIGSFCSIAENVKIFLGGNHRTDWITTFPFGHIFQNELGNVGINGHPSTKGSVCVENDVWIGSGVTILSGVTISDGAVVAANSTITRNVGPYEIYAGNPGKFVKKRFPDNIIVLLQRLRWWDLPVEIIRDIAPLLCKKPSAEELEEIIQNFSAV